MVYELIQSLANLLRRQSHSTFFERCTVEVVNGAGDNPMLKITKFKHDYGDPETDEHDVYTIIVSHKHVKP